MSKKWSVRTPLMLIAALLMLAPATLMAKTPIDSCTLVTPPKTPDELIGNIKCAVARNMFFDDDIFTDDEKLWKLLGGKDFYKDFPIPLHLTLSNKHYDNRSAISVSHFPESIDQWRSHTAPSWSEQLMIGITKDDPPFALDGVKEKVTIDLWQAEGLGLDFAKVVRLFGPHWKPHEEMEVYSAAPNPAPSGKPLKAPSEPTLERPKKKYVGSYVIEYDLPTPPHIEARIVIHFDNDGYLQDFEITNVEKQP